ncbi:hypothetical protein SD70_08565 [Gordoniibacillus kamchatkensis]|uniref:YneQ n=1 Tax=Gordoniibacillus kamchatkensis TaxID=1590651 RepID=A0ABR5AJY2_9BACL|nr:hypothetical protein [Paenibacillus sp. VKM B-2647]KIL41286.1 hypothetical protein SD70_08565 [Paenibacillus sp. VKM B-2647]
MAFGITRQQLEAWKQAVARGEIAFLTHYWYDPRFPGCRTVTKAGCTDLDKLAAWCRKHGLNPAYIHQRPPFPHYDLIGRKQVEVLKAEGQLEQLRKFRLE